MRWIALTLVAACSGTSDLTCALLADPGNCWAQASAAMAACMPARATPATLAADRKSCTFGDGVVVTFDAPLPTDTTALDHLTFSVGTCGHFTDTFMNHMELDAGGHHVVSELLGGKDFELHCDSTTYATNFDTLFTCQPPSRAPTDGFSVMGNNFMFTLASVSTPAPLFTCN